MKEYRAVFANPTTDDTSRGQAKESAVQAFEDRPARAEETHEYLVGVEMREVDPWVMVPLMTLVELVNPPCEDH